ncbi:hypothetical protein J2S43_000884 [Catenuloplanes nepalensis]|uniref:Uncharacterized protein n=1 Tax=Catenuloplanes nepalensis TaxID=587533 RepID=A0ABT9MLS2_9ACTN|nr:Imm1 family immunity protein [Catenuloplanes nepalensis]MDP9792372.1 hypothetical protein [Catenuloplanes nepalensis]
MTMLLIDYQAYAEPIPDPETAAEVFDDVASMIRQTGRAAQAIWVRPRADGEDVSPGALTEGYGGNGDGLRVEIDVEEDRAAVTWLPDGTIAVERPPGAPLTLMWSADAAPITLAGSRVRVSAATARRLVLEYVATGARPTTGITWEPII